MAIEYLKKFFGEDGKGSITFDELSTAVSGDKELKLYNLADGGYVSKDKLDAKIAELASVRAQLDDAGKQIQSYKDMDIDGIKAAAKDWETKYKADTEKLQAQLRDQEYDAKISERAGALKFSSVSAKKAFLAELRAKKLTMQDGDVMGFDDFVRKYQETDPDAFIVEKKPEPQPESDKGKGRKKPEFSDQKTKQQTDKPSLSELMTMANEGKDISAYLS